jgi:hypothetical protein
MILPFGLRIRRTEEPRPDQVMSWVSFRSDHP